MGRSDTAGRKEDDVEAAVKRGVTAFERRMMWRRRGVGGREWVQKKRMPNSASPISLDMLSGGHLMGEWSTMICDFDRNSISKSTP